MKENPQVVRTQNYKMLKNLKQINLGHNFDDLCMCA